MIRHDDYDAHRASTREIGGMNGDIREILDIKKFQLYRNIGNYR